MRPVRLVSRLATLAAILLALAWGAARLPNTLRSTTLRGALAPQLISSVTPPAAAPQQYWQVGAIASADAAAATGMATTLRVVVPRAIADHTTVYYWIGSYLADGAFIQIGVAIPWYDHAPRWFYCAFSAAKVKGTCPMGPPRSGGANGTWHRFSLVAAPATGGGFNWTALMDDRPIGALAEAVGDTGAATPGIYVEQSAFAARPATDDLGPVEFRPALLTRHDVTWRAPVSALATYSASSTCPPYGIGVAAANDLQLGSRLACPASGAALW